MKLRIAKTLNGVVRALPFAAKHLNPLVWVSDITSRLLVEQGAEQAYPTTAGVREPSKIVKAAPGRLYAVYVDNNAAVDRYLHVFNAVALPANGTIPTCTPRLVPSGFGDFIEFTHGRPMSVGIVVALSSTKDTLTVAVANEGHFDVHYS